MKYITLIIGLLAMGCGKQSPDKELTAGEKVAGWPVMMIIMLLLGGCCFSDAGTKPQNWDLPVDFFPND